MNDDLLPQFLIEGRELIQLASDDLLALERDAADTARLDSAFRAVHTLKGSVGLFDFDPMLIVLRAAEDHLGAMRAGRLDAGRAAIGAVLDCIDACDGWIDAIARAGALPDGAGELGRRLADRLAGEPAAPPRGVSEAVVDHGWAAALARRGSPGAPGDGGRVTAIRYAPNRDCFFLGDDPMAFIKAIPGLTFLDVEVLDSGPAETFDPFACALVIQALSAAPIDAVRKVFQRAGDQVVLAEIPFAQDGDAQDGDAQDGDAQDGDAQDGEARDGEARDGGARDGGARDDLGPNPAGASGRAESREAASQTLRIDAARIDGLVDLVGELIVAKNGLTHLAAEASARDPALAKALAASLSELEGLTGRMHRAVMGARMLPLDRTFRGFPRLVRGIAAALGKDIDFSVEGGEVEADKAIVDGVFEPLLHLLRNAVDHGVETRERRTAAGKNPVGRIVLRADRAQDKIVIDVADDGAGIDPAAIRAEARRRGLMDAAALDALDDRAAIDLIFAPGFSTAASVTDISGRGVGMDAVRGAVGRLGGRVEALSDAGSGTTMRLTLPQSFALTTVIVVRVGNERYGVPIDRVIETARVPADRILPVHAGHAFALRDRTVPIVPLAGLLGLPQAPRCTADAKVIIAGTGDLRIAIEVDGFAERIEIMLRPMTGLLSGLPGVLGTALMGDGHVLIVLDLGELLG